MQRLSTFILVLGLFCMFIPKPLSAQYRVGSFILSNGGGMRSGSVCLRDALGEGVVKASLGTDAAIRSGFWETAGVTSAVGVAVEAFSLDLVDGGVVLSWTLSDGLCASGVNVYRAVGRSEFVRVSSSPIPAGESGGYEDRDVLPGKTYRYRIGVETDGFEVFSHEVSVFVPQEPLTLYQNCPNPFNPVTSIRFYVPERTRVNLEVFDVTGKLVRTLVKETVEQGRYSVQWNGRDDSGRAVASGLYFCRLRSGGRVLTRKMVLLK